MPIDADQFRQVMGNFATGVTVVTTAVDGQLHGFTANAVTSVSLEPLLFLVCVDKNANAHGELGRAAHFGVCMLSAEQIEISNLFARTGPPEKGSLRGAGFTLGTTGVPLIDDSIATIECKIDRLVDCGDHTIVLGEVVAGSVCDEGAPLLYFRGRYRQLAD